MHVITRELLKLDRSINRAPFTFFQKTTGVPEMESSTGINFEIDLISDLFEDPSESSGSEVNHADGRSHASSSGSNSRSGSENDTDCECSSEYSQGSEQGINKDDGDENAVDAYLNSIQDRLEQRLADSIAKAFNKFGEELNSEILAVPLDQLDKENRSRLESYVVRFYSTLREKASSCLYTFYGPKSYGLNQLLLPALDREERRARFSLEEQWQARNSTAAALPKLTKPTHPVLHPGSFFGRQARPPIGGPPPPPKQQGKQVYIDLDTLSETSYSPIDSEDEVGCEKDTSTCERKRPWNHITISRDQTQASNINKELLLILRMSRLDTAIGNSDLNLYPRKLEHENTPFIPMVPAWHISPQTQHLPPHQEILTMPIPVSPSEYYAFDPVVSSGASSDAGLQNVPSYIVSDPDMGAQPHPKISDKPSRPGISSDNIQFDVPGDGDGPSPTVDQLMGRVASLETENKNLKEASQGLARYETVYFIQTEMRKPYLAFLDEPTWAVGPRGEAVLKSHFGMHDVQGFMRQKNDVAFVINKFYDLGQQEQEVQQAVRDKRPLPRAQCSNEVVRLLSPDMIQGAEDFFRQKSIFPEDFPGLNLRNGIEAPYLFWYYCRSENMLERLSSTSLAAMKLLTSWIENTYGQLYDRVEAQLKRSVISPNTIKFLVKPGDVVVRREKRDLKAVVAKFFPLAAKKPQARQGFSSESRREDWGKNTKTDEAGLIWKSSIEAWEYGFDGSFYRRPQTVQISFEAEHEEDEILITGLSAYPLAYACEEWKETLEARGKMFWSCRNQRIASYKDDRGLYGVRYMPPFPEYRTLQSVSTIITRQVSMPRLGTLG